MADLKGISSYIVNLIESYKNAVIIKKDGKEKKVTNVVIDELCPEGELINYIIK